MVSIRGIIYEFLNVRSFDYTAVAGSEKVLVCKLVNHTSWVNVVSRTYCSMLVFNRCVIEHFVGVSVFLLCCSGVSVGIGTFVIGLSHVSSFFFFLFLFIYL